MGKKETTRVRRTFTPQFKRPHTVLVRRVLGRYVRKGEKGIAILAPIVLRNRDETTGDDEVRLRFKAAYVFDIAQTEGEPLPDCAHVAGDPGHYIEGPG